MVMVRVVPDIRPFLYLVYSQISGFIYYLAVYPAEYQVSGKIIGRISGYTYSLAGYTVSGQIICRISGQISIRYYPSFGRVWNG